VVVAPGRSLAAYGLGVPPGWCRTAAAAEAWALHVALMQSAFPPKLRTDCMSLLTTARGGAAQATEARRPLARIWKLISSSLDGCIEAIAERGLLVWMPAHQPLSAIGSKALSNGKLLTGVDWRANRLVDALAKQAAATMQAPKRVRCMLQSGQIAVKHFAALLGIVTHASNNHVVEFQRPDGSMGSRTVRDAQQPSNRSGHRRRRQPKPPTEPRPLRAVSIPDLDGRLGSHTERIAKRRRASSTGRARKKRAFCSMDGRPESLLPHRRQQKASCRRGATHVSWNAIPGVLPVLPYQAPGVGSNRLQAAVLPAGQSSLHEQYPACLTPAPEDEIRQLSRHGLKIAWPPLRLNACEKKAPTSELVASRSASSSVICAQGNGAECRTGDPEQASAFLDLQLLHEDGFKVIWPRS
jgi:hypothetical protein